MASGETHKKGSVNRYNGSFSLLASLFLFLIKILLYILILAVLDNGNY